MSMTYVFILSVKAFKLFIKTLIRHWNFFAVRLPILVCYKRFKLCVFSSSHHVETLHFIDKHYLKVRLGNDIVSLCTFVKFLDLILFFDLTWKQYITFLKDSICCKLNIFKVVSGLSCRVPYLPYLGIYL